MGPLNAQSAEICCELLRTETSAITIAKIKQGPRLWSLGRGPDRLCTPLLVVLIECEYLDVSANDE